MANHGELYSVSGLGKTVYACVAGNPVSGMLLMESQFLLLQSMATVSAPFIVDT